MEDRCYVHVRDLCHQPVLVIKINLGVRMVQIHIEFSEKLNTVTVVVLFAMVTSSSRESSCPGSLHWYRFPPLRLLSASVLPMHGCEEGSS